MSRQKTAKHWDFMTMNERIAVQGWYKGTESTWKKLTMEEREKVALEGTGCLVAWPTWAAPVDCVHIRCLIARGEQPKIALTNQVLKSERDRGYLRFIEDRSHLAKVFRYFRKAARETGIYDPWKLNWQAIVGSGVSALIGE